MAASRVFHGARAKVFIGENPEPIGIFNSFSYQSAYGVQPVYILGRFPPAELPYTHSEPVQWQASGWRVVDQGAFAVAKYPTINDLLRYEANAIIKVQDRATGKDIATIHGIRPANRGEGYANRQLSEVQISGVGIVADDESQPPGKQADIGGTDLPPATTT